MTSLMAKSSKKSARAKGVTQISISVPVALVAKIDAMAAAVNRNRSNFIATALQAASSKGK